MTIKPVTSASPRSSSEETSDSDTGLAQSALSPFRRPAGQEAEGRVRESDKVSRQARRQKKARQHRASPPLSHSHSAREGKKQRSTDASGYNSSDELESRQRGEFSKEKEEHFEQRLLKERGFIIKQMKEDGACLFRAIADQVYGDAEFHVVLRGHCMDYIAKNQDFFSPYVTEDIASYIARKRDPHCFGNNIEMQAMTEMFNRSIEVYRYDTEPINTFRSLNSKDAPIRVSYHFDIHYNSVIDPDNPSVGVGLGFAGLEPGLADRTLLRDAFQRSEREAIEDAMLRHELSHSDFEATATALEQQVLINSYKEYLESLKTKDRDDSTRRKRRRSSPRSTAGSGSDDDDDDLSVCSRRFSPPKRSSPPTSPSFHSLQHFQKRQVALLRMRQENMQAATSRSGHRTATATGSGAYSASNPFSLPTGTSPGGSSRTAVACSSSVTAASRVSGCAPAPSSKPASGCSSPPSRPSSPSTSRTHAVGSSSPPLSIASKPQSSASPPPPVSAQSLLSSLPGARNVSVASSSTSYAITSPVRTSSSLARSDELMAAELAASELLDGSSGVADLDEAQVLASVLAASKQQYFEDLKAKQSGH